MAIFTVQTVQKYGLLPSAFTISAGIALSAVYMGYMMITKPDVSFRPWKYGTQPPYQKLEPTEIPKLWSGYAPKTMTRAPVEIDAIRKELGSYNPQTAQ